MRRFLFPTIYFQSEGGSGGSIAAPAAPAPSAPEPPATAPAPDGGKAGDGVPSATVPRVELEHVVGQREGLKSKLAAAEKQAVDLQAQLEKRSRGDKDAQTQALEKSGDYEKALKLKTEEFAASIQLKDAEIAGVHQVAMRYQLRAAVASAENIAPSAVDDVTELLLPRLSLDSANGHAVKVSDANGMPAVGKDGDAMTLGVLVADWIAEKPHYRLAKGATGPKVGDPGGKGFSGDAERAVREPAYAAEWKKSDPDGFKIAMDALAASRLTAKGLLAADAAAVKK